ncbi:MAG: bifunctional protein-serine/threonine kinase/phosphatase [Betaproteobacteria bacterium]|nr:bifunctional protein-serine/threonine kinase/phosphatase [Betaproteobacteria bacterium]
MPVLEVHVGKASAPGPRPRNEDYCGFSTPNGEERSTKGILLAVADGVGGQAGGREASEAAVRGVLSDYYATPDTWEISFALDKVVDAINGWVHSHSAAHRELAGMATTLSALVLRGQRYHIAHVGDTRVYRLRDGTLERLTTDHVWDAPEMQHVLKRAVGLDRHIAVDYSDGEAKPGDVFLLASDGVWNPLGDASIANLLIEHREPQAAAQALVSGAFAANGQDNATALVVRVDSVGDERLTDAISRGQSLPIPPRLKPGHRLDGFEVLQLRHESRATLLYKVRDIPTGQLCALKTLQPALADDAASRESLLNEEWLAKRLVASRFPQVLPVPMERRSALYYVMTYHEGETLQQKLDRGHHFPSADVAWVGINLLKGLGALHRLHVVHRDIKPANLHLGEDGQLRILDLGVASNVEDGKSVDSRAAGTPSFMAPEMLSGEPASVASDLYAAGVTLYHLLTRRYPYGEVEPFQHPRFGDPTPPTRYRPDIPQWLENILLKAVARDKEGRFETAEEMLLALEHGEARPLNRPRPTPLASRNPVLLWQGIAALAILLNILLAYLLIIG